MVLRSSSSRTHLAAASQLIRAFGHIGCIVGPQAGLDLAVVKDKAASFDYEYMFAKTDFAYHIASQGAILSKLLTLYQRRTNKGFGNQRIHRH